MSSSIIFLLIESACLTLVYGGGIWLLIKSFCSRDLSVGIRWNLFLPSVFSILIFISMMSFYVFNSDAIVTYTVGGYLFLFGLASWLIVNFFKLLKQYFYRAN